MSQGYFTCILMLFLLFTSQPVNMSVIFELASTPAVFGQNVTLTCYVQHPLLNSKECPVRQWTIGANTAVLLYNDFSYITTKYVDTTDLNSDHFSLTIMKFSFSDVNKKYTCSCGFSSSSMYLALEESMFVHNPDNPTVNVDVINRTLSSELVLRNVFPIPTCTLNLKGHNATNNFSSSVEKNGLVYDVSVTYGNQLTTMECNTVLHPVIECQFHNNYSLQFIGGMNYTCEVQENDDKTDVRSQTVAHSNTPDSLPSYDTTNYLALKVVPGIIGLLFIGAILVIATCRKRVLLMFRGMHRRNIEETNTGDTLTGVYDPAQNPTSSFPLVCRDLD